MADGAKFKSFNRTANAAVVGLSQPVACGEDGSHSCDSRCCQSPIFQAAPHTAEPVVAPKHIHRRRRPPKRHEKRRQRLDRQRASGAARLRANGARTERAAPRAHGRCRHNNMSPAPERAQTALTKGRVGSSATRHKRLLPPAYYRRQMTSQRHAPPCSWNRQRISSKMQHGFFRPIPDHPYGQPAAR